MSGPWSQSRVAARRTRRAVKVLMTSCASRWTRAVSQHLQAAFTRGLPGGRDFWAGAPAAVPGARRGIGPGAGPGHWAGARRACR